MKNKITLIAAIIFSNIIFSQTTLSAGDIAIVQYNSDNPGSTPEVIKFVILNSLESGTVLNFTDHGWKSDGSFRDTEGVVAWTATRDFVCGEVVTMEMPTTSGSGFTLTTVDSGFALTTSGDQIIVFQGDVSSPTFIFAINNEGSAVWQSDSTNSRTSAIPTGLTNGTNAVALTEIDNAKYDGSLSGSKSTVLSNICNQSNWTGDDASVITFSGTFNTTWNGSIWDGAGSDFLNATLDGIYSTSSNGNFSACNCTVNSALTVDSGGEVIVENDIINNSSITVESGGSVVQVTATGVDTGSDYTVKRETTSQSSFNVFTYWSTPITSATFAAVSPTTHEYFSFNAAAQEWVLGNASTPMTPGEGYALEGPDTGSYPGPQTATFTGAPFNNGDISVGLSFSSDGDADNDWNLIGNPYPSAIDAFTFLDDNSAVLGGTIYFWTHNTAEDGTVDNTEDDYAMYTYGSGGAAAVTGGSAPDGNIASTQGFFAQAIASGSLSFTNSMRISGNNTSFFKSKSKIENSERDRIWLNLTTDKSFSQILVGFFDEATDGIESKFDGVRLVGKSSLNFYSLIDDIHLGIQGKSSLKEKEIIPLGFSASTSGYFTISIDKFEGRLEDSNIFLEDVHLNVKHNLKNADYVFNSSESGEFNNRFNLIIETKASVLSIDDNSLIRNIKIKDSKEKITIETLNNAIIKKVLVYNILGKQVLSLENKSSSIELEATLLKSNSILILKTILDTGEVSINKIYKN